MAKGYRFCAQVIWNQEKQGRADFSDVEAVEALANDGWELVKVVVPFSQCREITLTYPGNTGKLIAYFRRPEEST